MYPICEITSDNKLAVIGYTDDNKYYVYHYDHENDMIEMVRVFNFSGWNASIIEQSGLALTSSAHVERSGMNKEDVNYGLPVG